MTYYSGILLLIVSLLLPLQGLSKEGTGPASVRSNIYSRLNTIKGGEQWAGKIKTLEASVGRITDSESIWLHVEDRAEFRKWTYKLSKNSLNLARQEVRIYLQHVSPKLSISKGKQYNEWFQKKVVFELNKEFLNRRVRVDYIYLNKIFRIEGMVWAADTNVNIWMVRNGWSFYLLNEQNPPKEEFDFVQAERTAQERKVGLWKDEVQNAK